jgi:gp16 family phage-associated protein
MDYSPYIFAHLCKYDIPKRKDQPVTPQQRKKQFVDRGESVTAWAAKHGFEGDLSAVYRVLNAQSPARRGKHHEIAVKLGIKPAPEKASA